LTPWSKQGDKLVALVQAGRQTCHPACTESELAGRQTCHPGLSWATSLSPWSELGDKLVGLVTSGYV
jgi:hypothetical protein